MDSLRKFFKRLKFWRSSRYKALPIDVDNKPDEKPQLLLNINIDSRIPNTTAIIEETSELFVSRKSQDSCDLTPKSTSALGDTFTSTSPNIAEKSKSSYTKAPSPRDKCQVCYNAKLRMKKSKSAPCYVGSGFERYVRPRGSDSSDATIDPVDSSGATYDLSQSEGWMSNDEDSDESLYDEVLSLSRISLSDETVSTRRDVILKSLVSLNILTVEEAISASALPQDLLSHENQLTSQDLTSLEKNVTKEQSSEEKQQSLKEKSATSEKNDLSSHAQNQQLTLEEKPEACPNLTFVWLNNFIGMPDRLNLSPCFMDYLNFRCSDAEVMETLLQRPINFAINQTDAFAQILSPHTKVKDMLEQSEVSFYSFCQGRAVLAIDFQHCQHCHVCTDISYKHCFNCHKCSLGLNIGNRCEHCDFTLVGSEKTSASVASFSELSD